MLICPEASSAQNNIAAVSADGSRVCVLIRRLNSSCKRSIAFVVRALRGPQGRAKKCDPRSLPDPMYGPAMRSKRICVAAAVLIEGLVRVGDNIEVLNSGVRSPRT